MYSTTRRALSFLMRGKVAVGPAADEARQIVRDIESLDGHTTFLFGKINFLMDATVGFHQHQPEQARVEAEPASASS